MASNAEFDDFFDVGLHKLLNEQSHDQWNLRLHDVQVTSSRCARVRHLKCSTIANSLLVVSDSGSRVATWRNLSLLGPVTVYILDHTIWSKSQWDKTLHNVCEFFVGMDLARSELKLKLASAKGIRHYCVYFLCIDLHV